MREIQKFILSIYVNSEYRVAKKFQISCHFKLYDPYDAEDHKSVLRLRLNYFKYYHICLYN